MVESLVERGADPTIFNYEPIIKAIVGHHDDVFNFLLSKINIDLSSRKGSVDFYTILSNDGKKKLANKLAFLENDPENKNIILNLLNENGLYVADFVYKYILFPSGRLRTRMLFIPRIQFVKQGPVIKQVDTSQVLISKEWRNKIVLIEKEVLLPVLRYQSGMSLFFRKDIGGKSCGTFYYFEQDSPFFLKTNKILIGPNKSSLLFYLWKMDPKKVDLVITPGYSKFNSIEKRVNYVASNEKLRELLVKKHKFPLKITIDNIGADEYNILIRYLIADILLIDREDINNLSPKIFSNESNIYDSVAQWINDISLGKSIIKYIEELYAFEDRLDMILCEEAQSKGIETIILTEMYGGNRLVTEVYDLRSREVSFNNIVSFK